LAEIYPGGLGGKPKRCQGLHKGLASRWEAGEHDSFWKSPCRLWSNHRRGSKNLSRACDYRMDIAMNRTSPYYINLFHANWKKLNKLASASLCHAHLLSVCTCLEKSGHPGPRHDQACPCYATSRVSLLKCNGVERMQVAGADGHYRKYWGGPIELHLIQIEGE
jgi:hypothetical protein